MNPGATLANAAWLAAAFGAHRRFRAALHHPAATQGRWLLRQLQRDADSQMGRQHDFAALRTVGEFQRRVPLTEYADLAPAIARIRGGERDVLAAGAVTHLAPTSGSTGARKLIPFSAGLQSGFDAAVAAWMHDLVRQRPRLIAGPAYWSISPLADAEGGDDSVSTGAIPVGFADDAEYLGAGTAWLVRRLLAAPSSLRHVRDVADFWRLTALALLRQRELRVISIWHPSFAELLVAAALQDWSLLLEAIASGSCPWVDALPVGQREGWHARPAAARAAELRRLGPAHWGRWWPALQVVSCWGAQAAEPGWRALVRQLPGVLVQPKGLLATEAVVTVPIGAVHPLAVTSHFFEFLAPDGTVRLAHELSRGAHYEIVVSNGGGLWRYRLGDVVECTGHLHATPTLEFLGRSGRTSDLRGEKLTEPFVASVLRAVCGEGDRPAYLSLRPRDVEGGAGYELVIAPSGDHAVGAAQQLLERVERGLCNNPHYALARRLGQLRPLRLAIVPLNAGATELANSAGRIGDTKPRLLLDAVPSSTPSRPS